MATLTTTGDTPTEVLLGVSVSFIVQNISVHRLFFRKSSDVDDTGGYIKKGESAEFDVDMLFWCPKSSGTRENYIHRT